MGGWVGNLWSGGPATEADAWLVLQTLPGVTPERLVRLVDTFGGPEEALAAPTAEFARIAGRRARQALESEPPVDMARRIRQKAEAGGARIVTRVEEAYPESLRHTFSPPGALFVEGEILREDALAVSVVGTRKPTGYGRRMAREIAGGLARKGITVVSGLAYGIDAEAHKAALEAGGRTLAVLGCGMEKNYPADHAGLRREIAAQGAVLTEFAWETPPRAENFPRRNRIISGLSLATIVIEAAERSGALITARLALDQGREVMAVPGPADSGRSAGCHQLIREGAHLVQNGEDALAVLPAFVGEALAPPPRGAGEIPLAGEAEGQDALEAPRHALKAPQAVRAGVAAAALP
ncbi:MAG: DNA-processing protein DprA, partial [bacterium]